MKRVVLSIFVLFFSVNGLGSDHKGTEISFDQRQKSVEMKITSVQLKEGGGIILAEGNMGEYGRVYTTYELTADAGRSGGLVTGQGRGFGPNGSFAYASFSGIYHREGTVFTMHTLVRLNDGTQNLDKIIFDGFNRTLKHDVYVVR